MRTRTQPVAIRDVLRLLVACARLPDDVNRTFDIGGPDIVTYRDMMRRYAAVAGLPNRLILPVPVLTPRLSSLWVGLVTPVPGATARPLVESLRHEVVCAEHDIDRWVPPPPEGLLGLDEAVRLALQRVRDGDVATRWSSASAPRAPSDPLPTDPTWTGGSRYTDDRQATVDASPEALWRVVEGIGGETGWYSSPLAWSLRGWLDTLVGGVGLRRGRRDAVRLRAGDCLDFWRVEEIEPGRLLRLRAEMRLPGRAWLEMTVDRDPQGQTVYRQHALFCPPTASPGTPTGGASSPSTPWCSAAWPGTSSRRRKWIRTEGLGCLCASWGRRGFAQAHGEGGDVVVEALSAVGDEGEVEGVEQLVGPHRGLPSASSPSAGRTRRPGCGPR
ncbi:hypothetical protein GCM10020000_38100 [Streptomyces olivoverticillatus]